MLELKTNEKEPGYYIRLATTLSILSKTPIKIQDIRLKEDSKGLNKSDIMYVKILAQLCNAKLKNFDKGKNNFTFEPGPKCSNGQIINLQFPALISLFLPYIMMIFYNTNHKIRMNGPTNREKKITVDYLKDVICPLLNEIGIKQRIDITKRGYYQDLGSIILTTRETKEILPLILEKQGELDRIYATVHSYGYSNDINQYMIDGAQKRLKLENLKINNVDTIYVENREKYKGYGIDLFGVFDNNIVLGGNYTSIKKQASQVGKEAADRLVSTVKRGLPLDKHASNIIIPILALGKKESRFLVQKNDEFINIATELCNKMLGTEFEFKDVDEDKTIISIKPKL